MIDFPIDTSRNFIDGKAMLISFLCPIVFSEYISLPVFAKVDSCPLSFNIKKEHDHIFCNRYKRQNYAKLTAPISLTTPLCARDINEDMIVNRCEKEKVRNKVPGSNLILTYKDENENLVELNSKEFNELDILAEPYTKVVKETVTSNSVLLFTSQYMPSKVTEELNHSYLAIKY